MEEDPAWRKDLEGLSTSQNSKQVPQLRVHNSRETGALLVTSAPAGGLGCLCNQMYWSEHQMVDFWGEIEEENPHKFAKHNTNKELCI